jgi:hypothetical protein
MEEEIIQEGNKLIAESPFASIATKLNIQHCLDNGNDIGLNEYLGRLKYHLSWDDLMPICDKINSKEGQVMVVINNRKSITPYINKMRRMKHGALTFDINETWLGVIEFINWYNTTTTQPKD